MEFLYIIGAYFGMLNKRKWGDLDGGVSGIKEINRRGRGRIF